MNNRIDAIYARQSVDKKDSISIESQIEFCKYELKGGNCKEYKDKGYSGKNTERPQFQQLMRDIESGLVRKVVVYKLDRISRSILDFAKMMDFFQKYEVEFVSSTEKFDTSTPMGRAMLNICIVFAQLERETIQKRVQDAWYSRCQRGFKMGGKTPYGFRTEPYVMDGVRTKKLVIEPTEAAFVRQMYEMYADPQVSLHDITKKLTADGMRTYHGRPLSRATLSVILRNPIYVMADLDIYEFYKSQGTDIYNDAADFAGTNGCYYYQGKGNTEDKHKHLQGQTLVLAPHEGFIPSELWLKCRKKLLASHTYQPARKARNTWMAGKIKCGNCGYALMSIFNPSGKQYLRCTKRLDNKSCPGCGKIITSELEAVVYQQMVKKLASYKTLTGRKKAAKANPKIAALQVELAHVDSEIEKLVDSLTGANNVLLSYVNVKIAELDGRKQELLARIAELTVEAISPEQVSQISGYLDTWENVSFDDKRQVVDLMITTIAATSDSLNITWKI
ncbi:recombinase family protein [Faecalibacterium longum]|nr:recombinase family protein [Faecalibacterium longum]MCC2142696.1 recombinase family protein [Faecalibacterium longum CLA-AA-H243]